MFKIHTILCPVDFSDASKKAIRYAMEFAGNMGASVYLLNVVEPRPMAVDVSLNYVPFEADLEKPLKRILRLFLKIFMVPVSKRSTV